MIFLPDLNKSHVQQHLRTNASGSVSVVHDFERKDHPKGTEVMFKPEGGKSYRSGEIVNIGKTHYAIQGKRQGTGKTENHRIHKTDPPVYSMPQWEAKKAQTSGTREATSSTKRQITVEESNRRAAEGYKRLGMSEDEVLQNSVVAGAIKAATKSLANANQLHPSDFHDLKVEYSLGMVNALRRETAKAPMDDIEQFRRQLAGDSEHNSRIFVSMLAEGNGAAIRFLRQRQKEGEHIDIVDLQAPTDATARQYRKFAEAISTPATQEQDVEVPLRPRLDRFLLKLPPEDAEIIRYRFGIEDDNPLTNEQIADIFNQRGNKYQDKYKWDRNHVGIAFNNAVMKLRSTVGIEELREFLKSLREHVDLIKSRTNKHCLPVHDLKKSHPSHRFSLSFTERSVPAAGERQIKLTDKQRQ